MNSHGDRSSWFMTCELGTESLRPRWVWGVGVSGLHGTNSHLCCIGWRHRDLPSPPLHHHHHYTLLTPGLFAHSEEPKVLLHLWLLKIFRNPARLPCGINASVSAGHWNALNALPAAEDACCVCTCGQASFISRGRLMECWIIHQESKYLLWFQ